MDLPRATRHARTAMTLDPDLARYRPPIQPPPRVTMFSYWLTALRTKRLWRQHHPA